MKKFQVDKLEPKVDKMHLRRTPKNSWVYLLFQIRKQKEEHDASLEALVHMRLATLTMMLAPLSGGAASRPAVSTPSLGQQPPNNEHSSVPWLYARPQVEKPRYNPQGKPPLLDETTDFAL